MLTASADSINEGGALTFTVTASAAVTTATEVTFQLVAGNTAAANQGTTTTNLNDFSAGAFTAQKVTIPVGSTTATFTVTPAVDTLTELTETFSVQATVGTTVLTKQVSVVDGGSSGSLTFTLAGDLLTGTTGNDTFTAQILQNTAGNLTDSFQSIDIVDGKDGDDTVVVQTQGGVKVAPTITNVENITYTAFAAQDYNMVNTTGVTKLTNSGSIADLTLSNVSKIINLDVANVTGNNTILKYAAAAVAGTADTQKIVLNKATTDHTIQFDAAVNGIETLDITSSGGANKVTALQTPSSTQINL